MRTLSIEDRNTLKGLAACIRGCERNLISMSDRCRDNELLYHRLRRAIERAATAQRSIKILANRSVL